MENLRLRNAIDEHRAAADGTGDRVSAMAHGLIGSEILKIANEIRTLSAGGKEVCDLTVGDFRSTEFRIPKFLEDEILSAIRNGETNYPPSDGMVVLRENVVEFYRRRLQLSYGLASTVISGGSRPAIYAAYRALVDPGDAVVYPVPSWNNNHYSHLVGARGIPVRCLREENFLPTRKKLERVIRGARMLCLNSPLNPTGTAFDERTLREICELVLEENERRSGRDRPLYLLYDQVYWLLTFGPTRHLNPVTLLPALMPYTVLVDGISKPFAATGIRVGWVVGPSDVVTRMGSILGHVGAWAPRAEQIAVAKLLASEDEILRYHEGMKGGLLARLNALFGGLMRLREEGFPVDALVPMGAIYLSARFALIGKRTDAGMDLKTNEQIRQYLLQAAQLAVVPFQAFGTTEEDGWFRLSVGAVSPAAIERMFSRLRNALASLS